MRKQTNGLKSLADNILDTAFQTLRFANTSIDFYLYLFINIFISI